MAESGIELLDEELKLESGAIAEATDRYRKKLAEARANKDADMTLFTPEMALLLRTIPPLSAAIQKHIWMKTAGRLTKQLRYALKVSDKHSVSPEELALLTIRHCFNHHLGVETIQKIAISLADAVRVHKDDLRFQAAYKGYHTVVSRSIKSDHQGHRHKVMTFARKRMGIEDAQWDSDFKLVLGKTLIDLFCLECKLFDLVTYNKPKKRYDRKAKRYLRERGKTIIPTKRCQDWLDKHHEKCEVLTPVFKPMIVEPDPWSATKDGGYASPALKRYRTCHLLRALELDLLDQIEKEIAPEVYEGVNALQRTPYRINVRVLEVVKELKFSGLAGLPDGRHPKERVPVKPWKDDAEYKYFKEHHPEKIQKYNAQAHAIYQEYWLEKSKRTALVEKVRIAEMFSKYDRLWFPMSLDWRGRVFAMSTPVLTPQGDDAAKGMLEFADGKKLTKAGVRALKIHGANCAGVDKVSLDDRVKWVEDHEEVIMAVNDAPFGEAQMEFWTNVDEPFQFLAFCFDYAGYIRNGESWVSHLICAIDQTCSGLQHWSAVLHDEKGAAEVGMVDKPEPDDVYSKVAEVVSQLVKKDDDPMAIHWIDKVTRIITKRNVMTRLYGATAPGMRDQVKAELKHLDKKAENGRYLDGCEVDNFKAAAYISQKNREGMAEVVAKADEGMNYVQKVAEMLAKEKLPVRWTSPIGLPIVQTYWKTNSKRVYTYWLSVKLHMDAYKIKKRRFNSQRVDLNLSHPVPNKGIQIRKATNSIAPNFVHSMDASHLLFTAISWQDKGMECLVPVHDSFGCHACDVPELHKVVREQFVMMYEDQDWLGSFRDGIAEYFPAILAEKKPENGSFDFNHIIGATYFSH